MKSNEQYPLNLAFIRNRTEQAEDIINDIKPHKGVFVGLQVLDAIFPDVDEETAFSELMYGERFDVCRESKSKKVTSLVVKRSDGVTVGYLSFTMSVLLTTLMKRGIESFCFLEAKAEESGIRSVALSVYCDEY